MKQKRGFALLALLLAAFMLLALFPLQSAQAKPKTSGNGIYGNGTWGIFIDIYKSPFTDYADTNYKYAQYYAKYAYGGEGCAWFAAARVKQITGKNCYIRDGESWYSDEYASHGFARGQKMPTGKALACYGNHVSVIEAVQDDHYLVSEGGFSGGGKYVGNDYCVLQVKNAKQLKNESGCGDFIGFVYLTDDAPFFLSDKTMPLPTLKSKTNGIELSWNPFNLATGYRIYRKENPSDRWVKLVSTKKTSYTDTTAESGKLYYYTLSAYYKDPDSGEKISNKKNNSGISGAYLEPQAQPEAVASDGKITVNFRAVTGAQKYLLYRKESGGSFTKIASLGANARSYTDSTVSSGTTYVYRVRPYTKITGTTLKGKPGDSTEVLAFKTPQAPKMTGIYETTPKAGTLSATLWFKGNSSRDYTVYRRVKGTTKWKKMKTIGSAEFSRLAGSKRYYSFRDATVKKGKTYEYTVGCHQVIGTHDLNSPYGNKKMSIYIASKPLTSFLSDFQAYGKPANSGTRVYRYTNKSNNRRLLKALYKDPSAYMITKAPKGTRKVVSGTKADPYKKFTGVSYVKVKEKAIRWTAKNIFHCQTAVINDFRNKYLKNREADKPYIDGNYFYTRQSAGNGIGTSPHILSLEKKNGYYYVKYKIEDNNGGSGIKDTQYAVLKKEKINGSAYWTLYTHNVGKFLAP